MQSCPRSLRVTIQKPLVNSERRSFVLSKSNIFKFRNVRVQCSVLTARHRSDHCSLKQINKKGEVFAFGLQFFLAKMFENSSNAITQSEVRGKKVLKWNELDFARKTKAKTTVQSAKLRKNNRV